MLANVYGITGFSFKTTSPHVLYLYWPKDSHSTASFEEPSAIRLTAIADGVLDNDGIGDTGISEMFKRSTVLGASFREIHPYPVDIVFSTRHATIRHPGLEHVAFSVKKLSTHFRLQNTGEEDAIIGLGVTEIVACIEGVVLTVGLGVTDVNTSLGMHE